MKTKIYMLTALATCIGLLLTGFSPASSQLETNLTLTFSGAIRQTTTETYTYIISVSDSNYQMKNGTTGQVVFQSTSSSQVFSNVVGNCSVKSSIDVESGVYTVSKSWTMLGINNITVNFENDSILLAANNLNAPVLYLNEANNCVISGITINGNAANQAEIDRGGEAPEPDGILIGAVSSNNRIDGVNITNCRLMGFRIGNGASENNGITNSAITFCGWNGIGFGLYTNNSYAENVQVAYCGDVGISTYGTSSVITNNYVHDMNGTLGSNNANWGIAVEGGSNDLITNNNIQNCSTGIKNNGFNNCTISDNTILNNAYCGVALFGEYNSIINNYITNVTNNGGEGVWLGSSCFNTIRGNNVSEAPIGIMLDPTSNNNTLSLNYVFDNGNKGVNIWGSNNLISQNQVYDSRSGAIRTQACGIGMDLGARKNVLMGNTVNNNYWVNIYDPNVPENTLINNVGYNPVGYIASPISENSAFIVDSGSNSTWISGRLYVNSGSPKLLNISGGTVSGVLQNGMTLFTATNCTILLQPGDTFSVTFNTKPTFNVIGQ